MQFNIAEAKKRFSEIVQKALMGEEVIIAKDNKPLLRFVPIKPLLKKRSPGSAKGQVRAIADNFKATPDDFNDYR